MRVVAGWVVGVLLLALPAPAAEAAEAKRVLIVHSFGTGAPPFTTHSTAFAAALAQEMGEPVDLDEISLGMARYAHPDLEEAYVQFLAQRLAKWRPDLVAPVGSPAGRFVAKHRSRLFPTTPVVYTGMDRRTLPPDTMADNATFVGESFDLPGLVEDILQLRPDTEHIAVVIGATPLERFWTKAFQEEFGQFADRVRFTWLNDLSFEEMLTRVASLPPRSFVLLGLLLRDAKGVTYNQDEALVRLHAVANAPINGMYQNQIGLGIVGGRLYQGELEGVEAARVAVRILRGAAAADIPPQIIHTQKPRYDWRELQRWGISESRLPLGSLVEFRAPPVWQQYWAWIIGAVLVGALQVGLIALLGVNLGNRRRAERALRESEERFRTVADSAPVMIWMSGVDKRCTFFNKPWLDFAGAPAEPDMSDGWAEGVHPDERARMLKDFAEAFDTRQPFVLDYRRRRHDGEYRWVSDHGVPRYDARGKFAGYIGSCSDVTERRQAEMEAHDLRQDLTHMSRVATMGELTAAIVHEISQPLTAIRGNADAALRLIAAGKRDQGQMGEILEDIAASGRRAGQVIQHLRSLFKKGEAERELLLLNDVVDEVVSLVGRDAAGLRDVAVERDLAPRMLPVSGDRIQLQHVVLNLAMNALDAMAEQEKRRRRLTVRTRAIGVGWVQLEVTDTGSGIPAEKLDSIFTPFVTTKAKGMGMGLAVSSTIVQAHGGTIAAENRPEGGAVFRVTLPVAPELSSVSAS